MNMKNPLNLDIEKIVAYLLFDMKWNDVLKIHCLTNEYDMSNRVYNIEGVAPTLTATSESSAKKIKEDNFRIRKLTPLECWRLMGFDDSDYKKAKEIGISDTQLYKQAGNSIVVNVLQEILKKLLKECD